MALDATSVRAATLRRVHALPRFVVKGAKGRTNGRVNPEKCPPICGRKHPKSRGTHRSNSLGPGWYTGTLKCRYRWIK